MTKKDQQIVVPILVVLAGFMSFMGWLSSSVLANAKNVAVEHERIVEIKEDIKEIKKNVRYIREHQK